MLPYYSFPFSYVNRNIKGMQPPIPVQPVPAPMPPTAAPVQPVQPIMPVCPYIGTSSMPTYTGVPTAPIYGPTGNISQPTLQPGVAHIPHSDEMDLSPEKADVGDPPPLLSNNPAITSISLFKQLTALPNYGNPSGNADILYTGNRGIWTFDVPEFLIAHGNMTHQIVIRGVLDDHPDIPSRLYTARITVNEAVVHDGPVPLSHGVPADSRFTNWRELAFNIPDLRRRNRVVIVNTSSARPKDWIGLDWMDLRFVTR